MVKEPIKPPPPGQPPAPPPIDCAPNLIQPASDEARLLRALLTNLQAQAVLLEIAIKSIGKE